MYIVDTYNGCIRKVTVSTGSYSGDNGPATSATLSGPVGVALDSTGSSSASHYKRVNRTSELIMHRFIGNIYIADTLNHRVRKVTLVSTATSTVTPSAIPTAIPSVIPTSSPTTIPTSLPR